MESKPTNFDLIDVLKVALKHRKHIFLITLIGIVVGIAVAFLITPKYEAHTVFYIPGNNSISKSLLAENNLENFMSYGDEDQIDQTLEMLNSEILKDKVIAKFDLINYYKLGGETKYPKTKTRQKLASNTEFKRTDNLAIKVAVKDEDPVLAADMANYISVCLDSMRTQIRQARGQQAYELIKLQYHKKQAEVDSILKALGKIRAQGIFDYEAQSKVLSKAMIEAQTNVKAEQARLQVYQQNQNHLPDSTIIRAKGRVAAANATYQSIQPTVANFGKLSGKYLELETLLKKEQESLANLQLRFEASELDYKGVISQHFLIEKAEVPEKSKYPNKTLLVFLFALSAFIISFLSVFYLAFIAPRFKE
ncbi:Wzz/FepE/Etk N-terminal domain-containing protein [Pedobacter arcticus]|uniref:Wzz/FepE/Etk N-terminal domain-containing protein n=1 Tax=Pedobacter arcticus TaxID=752140 RepID=UPI00031C26F3|nr:Wzz/FepE/Etk N-terminal domain-containing protein [Pedobacter arcticus]